MKKLLSRKKRILLVNRDFQLRYTKAAILVATVSTAATLFLILFPLYYLDVIRFPNFLPTLFLSGIALASVSNFAVIGLFAIHLTHRIAGPMFSLVRQMRLIQSGTWAAQLRVRSGDDIKYLVRNFNEMVDYLLSTSQRDLDQVDSILMKIRENQHNLALTELETLAQNLRARSNVAEFDKHEKH